MSKLSIVSDVTVFCSTTLVSGEELLDTGNEKLVVKEADGIPFVFVKTIPAQGNGIKRVENMGLFYKNLFPATKAYAKEHGKPDVIVSSSVHPLTMVAGIQIAKKMKIPCICEIRDLWPEAIFSFGKTTEKSLIGRVLIKGEHWIYKRATAGRHLLSDGASERRELPGWPLPQGDRKDRGHGQRRLGRSQEGGEKCIRTRMPGRVCQQRTGASCRAFSVCSRGHNDQRGIS